MSACVARGVRWVRIERGGAAARPPASLFSFLGKEQWRVRLSRYFHNPQLQWLMQPSSSTAPSSTATLLPIISQSPYGTYRISSNAHNGPGASFSFHMIHVAHPQQHVLGNPSHGTSEPRAHRATGATLGPRKPPANDSRYSTLSRQRERVCECALCPGCLCALETVTSWSLDCHVPAPFRITGS